MNNQAASNRAWLQARLHEAGLIEPLSVLAARIVAGEPRPRAYDYCLAYRERS